MKNNSISNPPSLEPWIACSEAAIRRLEVAFRICLIPNGPNPFGNSATKPTEKRKVKMTKKTMIAGAAIAGLMSGSFAVTAHAVQTSSKAGVSIKMGDKDKDAADKHSCKGMNSCKGKGGCKT